jgi:hypothetical protein
MAGSLRFPAFALFGLCLILSGCGGNETPPSTVIDACRMQTERPHWFKAMRETEAKWGVPVSVQLATIARESAFVADARPTRTERHMLFFEREVPRSSAYGYAQAIDGTGTGTSARPGGGVPTAPTSPTPRTSSAGI